MVIEPLEEKKVLLPSSTIQIPESTVSQEKPIDKARIDDTPPSEKILQLPQWMMERIL